MTRAPTRARLLAALAIALPGTPPSAVLAAQPVHLDRVLAEVEPAARRLLVEGNVPSATVALVAGDSVVWTGGFGHSNVWARTPAVPATIYLVGSTFKVQSTVALLQLMEQGRFALDDPVSPYLDGLAIRREDPARPVTFRHLLTHTSGLPADFGAHPVWGESVPLPIAEYLARDLEVRSPPRTRVVYSNMAYTLVAHLVEKISGVPYREYVEREIWRPLGMTSTGFEPTPEMEERLSVPYALDRDTGRPVPTVRNKAQVWPAGIVYGTVEDQARWLLLNLNGGAYGGRRLLRAETVELMQTLQFDPVGTMAGGWGYDPRTTGYGLTWWVSTAPDGDRYFAHSGSVDGYTAFISGNRTRKLGVVVLTNGHRAHPHLVRFTRTALEALRRHAGGEGVAEGR